MITTRFKPPIHPWEPPELAPVELLALKALSTGTANEGQQRMALATIVTKFAAVYDMSFRIGPDGERATSFAEGKRFVGQRILEAIGRPMKTSGEPSGTASSSDTSNPGSKPGPAPGRRNPKPAGAGKPAKFPDAS